MERKRTRDAILTPADLAAAERLRAAWDANARERGLTQDKMAEILGGTQGLVSHYLNRRAALNYRALMLFSKALGVDPLTIRDDLPEQALAPQQDSDWLPTLGYKQAAGLGHGQRADEWAEAHGLMFRKSFYSRIGASPKDCAIFYGKGDSMFPTIQDGDAFLFVTTDTHPRKGNLYLLHLDNATDSKEYNVKRCVGGGMFAADNPDGDHDWKEPRPLGPDDVVLGRVRWVGRMVK